MYGEGWIFEGGKGGLSGGGGSSDEWIWEEVAAPDEEYTLDCDEPLYYLGMMIDDDVGEDYYAFEIFMERKCVPSIGRFSTFSTPAQLDYDEDSTGDLETEEYTHLPVPATAFSSGEITTVSAYTYSTYRSKEVTFDGATYYYPEFCNSNYVYPHDAVLALRGQTYLDNLSGDYPGTIRIWSYAYQRVVLEETAWPGVVVPGIGGGATGIEGKGLETLPLPGLLNFPTIGLRRRE